MSENKISLSVEKQQFDQLIKEVRNLGRALAAAQIKPANETEKNARFLKVFGFSEYEIADLLGISQPAVNQALSKGKRRKQHR